MFASTEVLSETILELYLDVQIVMHSSLLQDPWWVLEGPRELKKELKKERKKELNKMSLEDKRKQSLRERESLKRDHYGICILI